MLKKLKKTDYIILKAYYFIILLNTLKKVFKSVLARRINIIIKQHMFFLQKQINVYKNRLTEIILKLLTKQIHII